MRWGSTALRFVGLGADALAGSLRALGGRLRLPQGLRASLTGRPQVARYVSSLVPFYEYDEQGFFRADGAPAEIASRRRAGFLRLAALYRTRFFETVRRTAEAADSISDLQFTQTYRVPFQFSRFVRRHLDFGALAQSSEG